SGALAAKLLLVPDAAFSCHAKGDRQRALLARPLRTDAAGEDRLDLKLPVVGPPMHASLQGRALRALPGRRLRYPRSRPGSGLVVARSVPALANLFAGSPGRESSHLSSI